MSSSSTVSATSAAISQEISSLGGYFGISIKLALLLLVVLFFFYPFQTLAKRWFAGSNYDTSFWSQLVTAIIVAVVVFVIFIIWNKLSKPKTPTVVA